MSRWTPAALIRHKKQELMLYRTQLHIDLYGWYKIGSQDVSRPRHLKNSKPALKLSISICLTYRLASSTSLLHNPLDLTNISCCNVHSSTDSSIGKPKKERAKGAHPQTLAVINVQSRKWLQFDRGHFCSGVALSASRAWYRVRASRRCVRTRVMHNACYGIRGEGDWKRGTGHRETIEIVRADIARLDNAAPYRKGGHRGTWQRGTRSNIRVWFLCCTEYCMNVIYHTYHYNSLLPDLCVYSLLYIDVTKVNSF